MNIIVSNDKKYPSILTDIDSNEFWTVEEFYESATSLEGLDVSIEDTLYFNYSDLPKDIYNMVTSLYDYDIEVIYYMFDDSSKPNYELDSEHPLQICKPRMHIKKEKSKFKSILEKLAESNIAEFNNKSTNNEEYEEDDDEDEIKYIDYDFKLINKYLDKISKESNNINYSPVSECSALQMFCYLNNITFTDHKDYINFKNNDVEKFVNRIWLNKKFKIKISKELKEFVYELDMSDSKKATKEKNDYVAEQTNNFITRTPSILSDITRYDLMNIVYFKDIWKIPRGYNLCKEKLVFNNNDGTTKEVNNFKASSLIVYENDSCYIVELKYKNGNTFNLIYPKGNIEDVTLMNIQIAQYHVDLYIPEFEIKSSIDLKKYIKDDIKIKDNIDVNLMQVSRIKVDHEGTEAAAATHFCLDGVPEWVHWESLELKFDKPFYYFIKDTVNDDILFIGKVVKL